jgi:hypothetical protein
MRQVVDFIVSVEVESYDTSISRAAARKEARAMLDTFLNTYSGGSVWDRVWRQTSVGRSRPVGVKAVPSRSSSAVKS